MKKKKKLLLKKLPFDTRPAVLLAAGGRGAICLTPSLSLSLSLRQPTRYKMDENTHKQTSKKYAQTHKKNASGALADTISGVCEATLCTLPRPPHRCKNKTKKQKYPPPFHENARSLRAHAVPSLENACALFLFTFAGNPFFCRDEVRDPNLNEKQEKTKKRNQKIPPLP